MQLVTAQLSQRVEHLMDMPQPATTACVARGEAEPRHLPRRPRRRRQSPRCAAAAEASTACDTRRSRTRSARPPCCSTTSRCAACGSAVAAAGSCAGARRVARRLRPQRPQDAVGPVRRDPARSGRPMRRGAATPDRAATASRGRRPRHAADRRPAVADVPPSRRRQRQRDAGRRRRCRAAPRRREPPTGAADAGRPPALPCGRVPPAGSARRPPPPDVAGRDPNASEIDLGPIRARCSGRSCRRAQTQRSDAGAASAASRAK